MTGVSERFAEKARELGQLGGERLQLGWAILLERLERRRRGRCLPASVAALGAAALLLLWRAWPPQPTGPLTYQMEGDVARKGDSFLSPPEGQARLVFSDHSQITMARATQVDVGGVDATGARIRLAQGDLDVEVAHRPGADWSFSAGPFTVHVRGTSFHLQFDRAAGRLVVQMRNGRVDVVSEGQVISLGGTDSIELFGPATPSAQPASVREPSPAEALVPAQTSPPAPARCQTRAVPPAAPVEVAPDEPSEWSRLLARGQYAAVVADAERRGISSVLSQANASELMILADCARYTRRPGLGRQALVTLRTRFGGQAPAAEAAFFLGRLSESDPAEAVRWYSSYLAEAPAGAYTEQALERQLSLLAHSDQARAQATARTYLQRYPHGNEAAVARSLLDK